MLLAPRRRAIFRLRTSKNGPNSHVFNILTCKYAWRHSLVPFFNIPTSESGLGPWVFISWLANALCATAACHFLASDLPKLVRTWCVLSILPWKRVPFFMSHLARWLRTRFSTLPAFATFLTFRAAVSSFFWLDFSARFSSLQTVGSLASKIPLALKTIVVVEEIKAVAVVVAVVVVVVVAVVFDVKK